MNEPEEHCDLVVEYLDLIDPERKICLNGQPWRVRVSIKMEDDLKKHERLVDRIDVMLGSAEANIRPIRRSLTLPPGPNDFAEFTIVATRKGLLTLRMILLVDNDIVHSSQFFIQVQ